MSSSASNITKKACDGCKIRKIRCGGGSPCRSCSNAHIKCTYIRAQQRRGPQKLRPTTKLLIAQAQAEEASIQKPMPEHLNTKTSNSQRALRRIPTSILAPPLYIYHVRMYPVWPIVDVETVISALQQQQHDTNAHREEREEEDDETYALATAVAAATIAQLRLGDSSVLDSSISAEKFAQECMLARRSCDYRSRVNLNNVRTAFFLHVYHENMQPGGSESLLYLREAISLAQMMYLHREASYAGLPRDEQQNRRRVLWLLFITERGVSILHKLPVILKTDISSAELDASADPQVLPAFLKLLALFSMFERSRMFDIMEDYHLGMHSPLLGQDTLDTSVVDMLQGTLRDSSVQLENISDVQRADLCVTRHWMRILLWKASSKQQSVPNAFFPQTSTSAFFPVMVANELLNMVSQLPRTAIEAHGLGMELKLYEVANCLADSVISIAMLPAAPVWHGEARPSNILSRMYSMLCGFRGRGNQKLAEILYKKMAEAYYANALTLPPGLKDASEQQGQTPFSAESFNAETQCPVLYTADDDIREYPEPDLDTLPRYIPLAFDPFIDPAMEDLYAPNSAFNTFIPYSLTPGSVEMLLDDFLSQVPDDQPLTRETVLTITS